MSTAALAWIFLTLACWGAALAAASVLQVRNLGWGNVWWFIFGWLGSELATFHIVVSVLVAAGFALAGALEHLPGRLALAMSVMSWGLFMLAQVRARPTPVVLEHALVQVLGRNYRERIPAARRASLLEHIPPRLLALPFALRDPGVERLADIPYADGHERHKLDIYRRKGGVKGAPVLLQIHGGAWVLGSKREQGLPLMNHMAARGWVVVAINYRLSPHARFPAHLIDCKRALAWIRANIADYGGDPSFIAVTGGSAGGHLASLVALTANEPSLQPGFESADTHVDACVPFYGVYDFPDRHGLRFDGGIMADWLGRTVMERPLADDAAAWDRASPVMQVRADAPPFFLLHGTHDSLVVVEEARVFAGQLRAVSRAPVAYAELAGAQHFWEAFNSVRALASVNAVARFLEWSLATRADRA
jgi:acetyl esterase/lipase